MSAYATGDPVRVIDGDGVLHSARQFIGGHDSADQMLRWAGHLVYNVDADTLTTADGKTAKPGDWLVVDMADGINEGHPIRVVGNDKAVDSDGKGRMKGDTPKGFTPEQVSSPQHGEVQIAEAAAAAEADGA